MVKKFEIVLDKKCFTPGSLVSGSVILKVRRPKSYEYIRVEFTGKALSRWCHVSQHEEEVEQYGNKEVYLMRYLLVWERENHVEPATLLGQLAPGEYKFPFQFQLPPDIPSSFKHSLGCIQYCVRAKIKSSSSEKIKHFITTEVPIRELVSINDLADLTLMHFDSSEIIIGFLNNTPGPVLFSFDLPRRAYCIGENIPLAINIMNLSPRSVRFIAKISRKAIFYDRFSRCTNESHFTKVVSVSYSVNARRTIVWDTHIHIPRNIHITTQTKVRCITVNYYLSVVAKIRWSKKQLKVTVPIVIRGGAADYATEQALLQHQIEVGPLSLPIGSVDS